ncbi:NAD(P)/FAD-dependent oxidoreductase [Halosimplex litoreum]|uniref:NAD(P)/FAD-dependent oxidoreductase n=1 Tax=Halosimplex litoreum TaxID=1198301 RepID=A0A7T3G0U2_9EURY|nr:FAD-dependent oxidoreductase [Halosimplex litoreum]QPV64294.1 NAD(P)/FAD-dependent oxidoreductase [Halosimplex litoreum]
MSDASEGGEPESAFESADAVVVGCGPAGAAAGVFLARSGLDTVVFDRGTASLDRCAFLGNYPGFPAGIDVETFQALLRDHARETGCRLVDDLVQSVERAGDADPTDDESADPADAPLAVETQDGRRVVADRVIAATRYTGEYCRPLTGDAMFEAHEHDGETHEHVDPDYADADGRTPVDGLYVASPAGQRDVQAVVAAGRGAHVARTLLEDRRVERGYPVDLARHYDWLRPDSEFEGEWGDRERWREWFDERVPEDHDADDATLDDLREEYIDDAFDTRRSADEVADLTDRGHQRLLEHLDDDAVLERAAEIEAGRTAANDPDGDAPDDVPAGDAPAGDAPDGGGRSEGASANRNH